MLNLQGRTLQSRSARRLGDHGNIIMQLGIKVVSFGRILFGSGFDLSLA